MKYPQLVSMPSAVSDWLEEQLEARGIDAVLYTRYVLSLLHTHTVDVIYPDEDLQFSRLKKEVRRSSGSRKRFRRSSDWWRHAQADAEQIKRSAAVECLMSASDQNCEIESLVDELCEKLKEVNSESSSPSSKDCSDDTSTATTTTAAPKESHKHKISPQELAEKYYAAFPALCPQSPTKLISLLPKWKPATSPVKKKNSKKQNSRQQENGDMFKSQRSNGKNCSNLNRSNGRKATEKGDNMDGWQFYSLGHKKKFRNVVKETLDQCIEVNKDVWNNEDEEMKMYEDLPVDISDLLDSPIPQDDTVEKMNVANMRDNGKRDFIPYRTNITSSIWSNDTKSAYDNNFNASSESAANLDFKFSSIAINNNPEVSWPSVSSLAENINNSFFDSKKNIFSDDYPTLPDRWKADNDEEDELVNVIALSLKHLNHNVETSCFSQIIPKFMPISQGFDPFSGVSSMFEFAGRNAVGFEREKEDLMTSHRTHFRPINEKEEMKARGQYEDGTTFDISNSLDKVEYKRSESGSMMLETESGQNQKYWEYKQEDPATPSPDAEFVLKFRVSQNDKACQTNEADFLDVEEERGDQAPEITEDYLEEYLLNLNNLNKEVASTDSYRRCFALPASSENSPDEAVWKYEPKNCGKCNNNNVEWNADWLKGGQLDPEWDSQSLKNIWSGGEVCETCLNLNSCAAPSAHTLQMREDIGEDGEQLLSHLSSVQKTYMEEMPLADTEASFDLNAVAVAPKERKRRHSFIVDETVLDSRGTWSFASRLEEDCLIQMSTLPTLRSVTL